MGNKVFFIFFFVFSSRANVSIGGSNIVLDFTLLYSYASKLMINLYIRFLYATLMYIRQYVLAVDQVQGEERHVVVGTRARVNGTR